jgi:thiol-disulfide isomerase/thioredoxin
MAALQSAHHRVLGYVVQGSPSLVHSSHRTLLTHAQPCLRVFPHLSDLAEKHSGRVSVIGINVENVFGESPDVDVRAFVANQTNLKYIVAVDIAGRAQELIYQPAGRLSVPTGGTASHIHLRLTGLIRLPALLITPSDRRVHFVGHPNKIPDEMLDALLM